MRVHSTLGRAARAVVVGVCAAVALPALADRVLLGTDYLQTVAPTSYAPLGILAGLPIGPGNTDTVVRRMGNCDLALGTAGSTCTVPIEMVALSLVSATNPLVRVRESPTLASAGSMTMTSNGSGTGGTFASFFDVFFELSFDGGISYVPGPGPLTLRASGAPWTTIEHSLLVDGLVGDPAANRHTNKIEACRGLAFGPCVDFYFVGTITKTETGSQHSFRGATPTPEPGALALAALGLMLMAGLARRASLQPR